MPRDNTIGLYAACLIECDINTMHAYTLMKTTLNMIEEVPPSLQNALQESRYELVRLGWGTKYEAHDVNGVILTTIEVILGRAITLHRNDQSIRASNLPLEQLPFGTNDIQLVSDSHSFSALQGDKILDCLLNQRNAMISKSQYTHMLRACRFVVRRSHEINAAQRLLAAESDKYLNHLRSVNAGADRGYIRVHRTTAVTDWKDIWREPIANITSPFLLEGY